MNDVTHVSLVNTHTLHTHTHTRTHNLIPRVFGNAGARVRVRAYVKDAGDMQGTIRVLVV